MIEGDWLEWVQDLGCRNITYSLKLLLYIFAFFAIFTPLTSHQELLGPSSKMIQMMKKIAPIILKYINLEEKKVTRCQVWPTLSTFNPTINLFFLTVQNLFFSHCAKSFLSLCKIIVYIFDKNAKPWKIVSQYSRDKFIILRGQLVFS